MVIIRQLLKYNRVSYVWRGLNMVNYYSGVFWPGDHSAYLYKNKSVTNAEVEIRRVLVESSVKTRFGDVTGFVGAYAGKVHDSRHGV